MKNIVFILILFSGVAYGGSEMMKITFSPAADGGGYVYEIDTTIIPSLPIWDTENKNPPLNIMSALAIAQNELAGQPQKQRMKLASIRLSSAEILSKAKVWYYTVTFINDAKNLSDGFLVKDIHILMNGNVLKARKITKEEYEQWFK